MEGGGATGGAGAGNAGQRRSNADQRVGSGGGIFGRFMSYLAPLFQSSGDNGGAGRVAARDLDDEDYEILRKIGATLNLINCITSTLKIKRGLKLRSISGGDVEIGPPGMMVYYICMIMFVFPVVDWWYWRGCSLVPFLCALLVALLPLYI